MRIVPRTTIRRDQKVGRNGGLSDASLLKFGDSGEAHDAGTKEDVIAPTDTDLKNDIPREYRLFAPRARVLLSLVKHERVVSAAIDLLRSLLLPRGHRDVSCRR